MMGEQKTQQDKLFYNFNLEDLVPEDHLLRHINAVLDLKDLRSHLAPYYSPIGRAISNKGTAKLTPDVG